MKNFISRIDQNWLLNRPTLWATRLHYFLYAYAFIVSAAYLIGLTFPMSTANLPSIEGHFMFALLLSCIAYLVWAYKASQFQVTAQFGNTSVLEQVKTQAIYLAITCMLGAVPFIYTLTLTQRVKQLVSDKELVYDCNVLNIGAYYLQMPYNRMLQKVEAAADEEAKKTAISENETAEIPSTSDYNMNYDNQFYLTGNLGEWQTQEVVAHIGKNKAEQIAQIEAYIQTLQKYGSNTTISANEIYDSFETGEHNYYAGADYEVENTLRDLSKAKVGQLICQDAEFQQFSLFFAFCLTMILFTFVATSLQTVVITIITAIIGSIAVTVFGAFSAYVLDIHGSGEETFFSFGFLCVVAALTAFGIWANNKPLTVLARQVALSIAAALTPAVPFVAVIMVGIKLGSYDWNHAPYIFQILTYSLFAASVVGSWLLWNVLYRPQLLKIQTIPVKN